MKKNNGAISSSNLTITMTTNTSGKDQRKEVNIFECSKFFFIENHKFILK